MKLNSFILIDVGGWFFSTNKATEKSVFLLSGVLDAGPVVRRSQQRLKVGVKITDLQQKWKWQRVMGEEWWVSWGAAGEQKAYGRKVKATDSESGDWGETERKNITKTWGKLKWKKVPLSVVFYRSFGGSSLCTGGKSWSSQRSQRRTHQRHRLFSRTTRP